MKAFSLVSPLRLPIGLCWALLLFLLLSLLPQTVAAAGPWYVTPAGDDANDCRTPDSPCATINGALNKPTFAAGDTVLVATGVYTGPGGGVCVDKAATLSGGWDATFSNQIGDPLGGGASSTLYRVVVPEGVTATMDRFTFNYGNTINQARSSLFERARPDWSGPTRAVSQLSQGFSADECAPSFSVVTSQGTFTLSNSFVTGVFGGYGINNYGTFTLLDSEVSGIYPTGIANDENATMRVYRSTVSNNGGAGCAGIGNGGTLILDSSVVISNSTRKPAGGGGICNSGNATLVNTTVSHNHGSGGTGGGIYNYAGTLDLYNSTIAYNSAGEGGGIFNHDGAVVTLQNTIVAENSASSGTQGWTDDCAGTLQSRGHNLISATTGCDFVAGTGDLLNVKGAVSPLLMGTPRFHPLPRTSPAINAGDPAGCRGPDGTLLLVDQRGAARQGRCDIGAYEYHPDADPLFYAFLPLMAAQ